MDAAAWRAPPPHRPLLGGQLSAQRSRLVRSADGGPCRIRDHRHLLLHARALRHRSPSYQRAAGAAGVCRVLRADGRSVLSESYGFGRGIVITPASPMRAIILV